MIDTLFSKFFNFFLNRKPVKLHKGVYLDGEAEFE